MKITILEQKAKHLDSRMKGINQWIRENINTDPNAYEITDCNVQYAEILSMLRSCYEQGEWKELSEEQQESLKQKIQECSMELEMMESLRLPHSFFMSEEPQVLYQALKKSQEEMNYDIPTDPAIAEAKRELLCKSMSVPFYIWQVQRTEPNYQYDNVSEYSTMQLMLDLYQSESALVCGKIQFKEQIEGLFERIEKNYKYSSEKQNKQK